MEEILKSILRGIVKNECSDFFKNLQSIFKSAVLNHNLFASEEEYREITSSYHPKGITRQFIFDQIDECEQFKDKVNEDGSVSRCIITAEAIKQWFSEEEEFFVNFFIKELFKEAMEQKLLSRENQIISYLWIHESGIYERKQSQFR